MALKSKQKVQALTERQEKWYLDRREMSQEMGNLDRRIAELKEDRKKLDTKLAPVFEQHGGRRKLSDGTIVERTVQDIDERVATEVGQVIQSGYSFPRYKEISG